MRWSIAPARRTGRKVMDMQPHQLNISVVVYNPGCMQVVTKFMLFCGTNCRDPRKSKYLLSARLSTR